MAASLLIDQLEGLQLHLSSFHSLIQNRMNLCGLCYENVGNYTVNDFMFVDKKHAPAKVEMFWDTSYH